MEIIKKVLRCKRSPLKEFNENPNNTNQTKKNKTGSNDLNLKERNNELMNKNISRIYDSLNIFEFPFYGSDDIFDFKIQENCFTIKKIINDGHIKLVSIDGVEYDLKLTGMWYGTKCLVDDQIFLNHVMVKNKTITVDNFGHIVTYPHWLISGSKFNTFYYCRRQFDLEEFFKGDISSKSQYKMLIGNIVHSIIEKALKDSSKNIDLNKYLEEEFEDKSIVLKLSEGDINKNELINEVKSYFNNIISWKDEKMKYFTCKKTEDNLYSLRYGLRGNIDVTLADEEKGVFPLEIKTGESMYMGYNAQLISYQLLLSESNNSGIMDGILLFLKPKVMESKVSMNTLNCDSFLNSRNYAASSLDSFSKDIEDLPQTLNDKYKCTNCNQRLTCSLLNKSDNSNELYTEPLKHLNDEMKSFFKRYANLIMKEHSANLPNQVYKKILNKHTTGGLQNVKFIKRTPSENIPNQYKYDFSFDSQKHKVTLLNKDHVILSNNEDERIGYITGYIEINYETNKCSIYGSNDTSVSKKPTYRIDKLTSMSSVRSSLTAMLNLMADKPIPEMLRKLIIEKKSINYIHEKKIDAFEHNKLNIFQMKVINKLSEGQQFVLVKGYPGTGKSVTIKHLIEHYAKYNYRILVAAYTHTAVQNIIEKLDDSINSIYIQGGNKLVKESLDNKTLDYFMKDIDDASELSEKIKDVNVFGVTCLSANNPILSKVTFDLIVIDEAAQITMPVTLIPLFQMQPSSQFVMFGDVQQLPPLITNDEIRNSELSESLFEKLCKIYPKNIVELNNQYRMNSRILDIVKLIYNNNVICGSPSIANFTIGQIPNYQQNVSTNDEYLQKCSSGALEDSVIAVISKDSYDEIQKIMKILKHLQNCGINSEHIGVISPFNSQVDAISKKLNNNQIEINTIDRYQGRDKNIIIVSFSKNNKEEDELNPKYDILQDRRRLNVCFSRSKCKLILVGNWDVLCTNYALLNDIYNKLS